MDTFSQIESPTRRRWHTITGVIICAFAYVMLMLVVRAYLL